MPSMVVSPNKALECVGYAHRTASPPRRGCSTCSLRDPHEFTPIVHMN